MAKFKIKGKKVTGTKKKDKIVWQKSWKKNLTVDALKGNDTIDFTKSKKTNTFIGGKGNDIIKTGKGTSTIVINKGDGNDTIYHNSKKTIIKVNKAKANDKQEFARKGNDLILTYTHGGTKTKEVLTFKNYYKGNKNIYLGKQKLETLINAKGMTITGTSGNDTINGSKGNDTINAGKGNNTIYLNKNEGTDTIINGGGNDTLVFSQESNFDNFSFTDSGDDLNIKAGGTTALLKGFNAGKSSVKTVKAGNQSFSKIIRSNNEYYMDGTNGNDLFLLENGYGNYVYAKGGNDIIYINGDYYDYYIYASEGNNYINAKCTDDTYIYLDSMNGNNTIVTDWDSYLYLIFSNGYYGDQNPNNEMLRILQLAEDSDGSYTYILGQKSGNDLIMKAINDKTVTIRDFYTSHNAYNDYFELYDGSYSQYFYENCNCGIFYETPTYFKLNGNAEHDTLNGVQNKYIYGNQNIVYDVTVNNSNYNNFSICGNGNKTININGAQLNYFDICYGTTQTVDMKNIQQNYMDINADGTQTVNIENAKNNHIELGGNNVMLNTFSGRDNYVYVETRAAGSVINFNGTNNVFETRMASSTVNINGTNNLVKLYANNSSASYSSGSNVIATVNTQGVNEICLYANDTSSSGHDITYNVASQGTDNFNQVNWDNRYFTYNYNFTGSDGKNKSIDAGYYNATTIKGVNDTGEIKISTERTKNYVLLHSAGTFSLSLVDFDMEAMNYHYNLTSYSYGPSITIYGAEDQAGADLNTKEFANKIKINIDGSEGEYKSLNNFAQYFNIDNSFTFGNGNYMNNLTKDYIVKAASNTNTTYNGFQFLHGRHTIVDAGGGSDDMLIAENIDDVRVYFDISADGSSYGSNLYFLKTSEYLNFMKGADVSGYIHIKDAFTTGNIELVHIGTDYGVDYDELKSTEDGSLIQEVAGWLTSDGRSFADTDAVLSSGTDAQKAALFAIYDKHAVSVDGVCENPYFTYYT